MNNELQKELENLTPQEQKILIEKLMERQGLKNLGDVMELLDKFKKKDNLSIGISKQDLPPQFRFASPKK